MKIVDKVKSNQKLMRFIETTQNRITDSEMGTTSVVVAYYLLLSLFPLMIALGNLLPYLSIDPNTVLSYVQELIPNQIYDFIGPAIENLHHQLWWIVVDLRFSGVVVGESKYQCLANCDEQSLRCGPAFQFYRGARSIICDHPALYDCDRWCYDGIWAWKNHS